MKLANAIIAALSDDEVRAERIVEADSRRVLLHELSSLDMVWRASGEHARLQRIHQIESLLGMPHSEPSGDRNETFHEAALRRYAGGLEKREDPHAVVVCGLEASGKGMLVEQACRRLSEEGHAAVIDRRELEWINPNSGNPDETDSDVRALAIELEGDLLAEATRGRHNLIIETRLERKNDIKPLRALRELGYQSTLFVAWAPPEWREAAAEHRLSAWRLQLGHTPPSETWRANEPSQEQFGERLRDLVSGDAFDEVHVVLPDGTPAVEWSNSNGEQLDAVWLAFTDEKRGKIADVTDDGDKPARGDARSADPRASGSDRPETDDTKPRSGGRGVKLGSFRKAPPPATGNSQNEEPSAGAPDKDPPQSTEPATKPPGKARRGVKLAGFRKRQPAAAKQAEQEVDRHPPSETPPRSLEGAKQKDRDIDFAEAPSEEQVAEQHSTDPLDVSSSPPPRDPFESAIATAREATPPDVSPPNAPERNEPPENDRRSGSAANENADATRRARLVRKIQDWAAQHG